MVKDVTGITVCYNTKDLIKRAYSSVRKFHPEMLIIIIDGSDSNNLCASYVKSLISNETIVISLGKNIGHGRGMCLGIDKTKTKYALIFDSDTEMLSSPIKEMLNMMEEDTFGVGAVRKTGFFGIPAGDSFSMLYLHPYFQLINVRNYKKFYPYVHHGAPCYLTMRDIHNRGLSGKILKNFPILENFIKHNHRGTRNERLRRDLPEIENKWVYK